MPPFREKRTNLIALGLGLAIISALLSFLFSKSFSSDYVLFSNDGPLGNLKADSLSLPGAFTGFWIDLNWVGMNGGSASPSITYAILWVLGPVGFAKFYGPLTLLILGMSAWTFFRAIGLRPGLAVVGGIAASLNMNYFSNTCWGFGTRSLTLASVFLSLAAIVSSRSGLRGAIRIILGGMAVGMAIMEGADNGAIFSLYVAAFAAFQLWMVNRDWSLVGQLKGGLRLAAIVVFATLLAAQPLSYLVGMATSGVAGLTEKGESKSEQWINATRWSLPKTELLRIVVPGLFGYRMDTEGGGNYWGGVGAAPNQPTTRHSGSGEYAGIMVVLLGAYAAAESLRKKQSNLADAEKKWVWFWLGAAVVSVLFAFGSNAPFYRIVYSLPYFSSIRNPIKWMHPFHLTALALMGYGMLALDRRYFQNRVPTGPSELSAKSWWARLKSFEKLWVTGSCLVTAASAVVFLVYSSSQPNLVAFLQTVGFPGDLALSIAKFSIREAGIAVVVLAVSCGSILLIINGTLSGSRYRLGILCLGAVIAVDLARANQPWIRYDNYKEKYATNPVFESLKDHAYEHRVAARIFPFLQGYVASQAVQGQWGLLCFEWLTFPFQFHNIQSLDVVQMPRPPALDDHYMRNFSPVNGKDFTSKDFFNFGRLWQLTNTRYILGMAGFGDFLNQAFDPTGKRFQVKTLFSLSQAEAGGPITVSTNAGGQWAVYEFTGALPRAKLFTRWQTTTNETETLAQLANPAFDPTQSAFVYGDSFAPPSSSGTNDPAGTVEFSSYSPKKIVLKAQANALSLLVLNDRHDPEWKVRVDGKEAPLLRCNYIMRGVLLPMGSHDVVFSYEPPLVGLYISLAAIGLGTILCCFLAFAPGNPSSRTGPNTTPSPQPAAPKSRE